MDAAKAIAAATLYDGDPWGMVYSRHDDVRAIPPSRALPLIQVNTLPATGSEMNQCAVISDRTRKEKSYIWAECLYAKVAIIDPELTYGLPPFQTACAAADSISHVLEIYLNGADGTPLQHYFQEGVMRTTMENAPVALARPSDADARTNLMWASTCAINGFASPGDAWTPMH
jgi:alcohol dehydrogenase YqhD (iron-dependent ADH family)